MEKTSYLPNSVVLLLELDTHAWGKKMPKKELKLWKKTGSTSNLNSNIRKYFS